MRLQSFVSAATMLLLGSPAIAANFATIHQFSLNDPAGWGPLGNLVQDQAGNIFGETGAGAASQVGAVYKLSPGSGGRWTASPVWAFHAGAVGFVPNGGLTFGTSGQLFGATNGNRYSEQFIVGGGAVFKLKSDGGRPIKAVASFRSQQAVAPAFPNGPVNVAPDGNVFAITQSGGTDTYGMILRFIPPHNGGDGHWTQQVLHSFTDGVDGVYPQRPMLLSRSGRLYGSAIPGAGHRPPLFQVAPPAKGQSGWQFSVVYQFTDCAAVDQLVEGPDGTLYGPCSSNSGHGSVFSLTPPGGGQTQWTFTLLYAFTGGADGGQPINGLTLDAKGNLYGTTAQGTGTLYRLSPPAGGSGPWTFTTLQQLPGKPTSRPLLTAAGTLVGTTSYNGLGTVYAFTP